MYLSSATPCLYKLLLLLSEKYYEVFFIICYTYILLYSKDEHVWTVIMCVQNIQYGGSPFPLF